MEDSTTPSAQNGAVVISSPELQSILTPDLLQIVKCLTANGYETRLVGGVVRDLLLGNSPKDIDLATTATPDQMVALFEREGLKYVPTGLQHGTLTVVLNQKNFEVTTLRVDKVTDGRHAEVDFTTDWKVDAERRDLTINAMSLGVDGTLFDYFDGKHHLEQRHVVFVGSADTRIKEDYLRILRYFRFHGRICKNATFDSDTLRAIRENCSGLERISGERIWSELSRILSGNNALALITCIYDSQVAKHIHLPAYDEKKMNELKRVYGYSWNPVTLLVTFYTNEDEWDATVARWHLSNQERDLGQYLIRHRVSNVDRKYCTDELVDGALLSKVVELLLYKGLPELANELQVWPVPKFPVNGKQLQQAGVKPGPLMGELIKKLRDDWKRSDYTLTTDALLSNVS